MVDGERPATKNDGLDEILRRIPARLLGIDRDCGTLEAKKRADFVLWDAQYQVIATFVGGRPVFGAGHLHRTNATSVA